MSVLSRWTLAIFILSALVYGVSQWQTDMNKPSDSIDRELTPDFIAESLKTTIYNENGDLSHEIKAQRMEHYSSLNFSRFEFPNYTLHPKKNLAPWHVKAKEATLFSNNKVVLKSNIQIISTEKDSLIHKIQGKTLALDLNTNIISSDQEIIIYGENFTMTGSGLIIDLNSTQMTLTKHGKTIFTKPNS